MKLNSKPVIIGASLIAVGLIGYAYYKSTQKADETTPKKEGEGVGDGKGTGVDTSMPTPKPPFVTYKARVTDQVEMYPQPDNKTDVLTTIPLTTIVDVINETIYFDKVVYTNKQGVKYAGYILKGNIVKV